MIGRIAAVGFLLLAAAVPAAADPTGEGLLREFVGWVDSSEQWSASVSVIRSEGSDTFAEGLVLSREDPHVSVSLETLRLRDLRSRDGGGFSASEIELDGGAVTSDQVTASIPSGALWNISLPSLAGVTLDPKHMMTSLSRFYSVAAEGTLDELRIPEITLDQREGVGSDQVPEGHVVYRDLSMTGLADGLLKHQQLGPISVRSKEPSGETFEFSIERMEADRLDLAAVAHIFDPEAYEGGRGDNIWRPLMSRIVYSQISGNGGDGGTFKVDEIAVENIDGRQPEKPFTAVWDRLIDPEIPEDSKSDLAIEAMTSMFSAWRVGTIRADGVSITAPKDGVSFSLSSATLTGWSSAGFDSFILDKLSGSSPDGFLSLGSLEMAGFIAPDIKGLVQFAAIEKDLDIQKHADAIKQAFAALPRLGHFGLHDLSAGRTETDSASLKSFTLDFRDWNAVWASGTDIRLVDLSMPRGLLELDPQATEVFDKLGYDRIIGGLSLSDRWDPETGTDNATWTLSMKDAADVELSYSLTGLTLDWLVRATAASSASEDSEAAMMAMVNELKVASAKVSITDRSLLDRAFAVAADKQGLNVEGSAYREQMRAALPFLISAAVPPEIAKLLSEPVQAFLAGGQTISADVTPPSPISIADLVGAAGNPIGLPDLLHLTLRTQTPAQ